jgi:superfamily II DNA or RNA helicase/HKD family nuclease
MAAPPRVASNILTSTTNPTLLERLKQMLQGSERADIAVGYLFLSGFHEVADQLEAPEKIRVLVGRADRPSLDAVAAGLQQADALRSHVDEGSLVRRSHRARLAEEAVQTVAQGVSRLPQDEGAERDVRRLSEWVASGKVEIKTYPKGMLHAKAYLCWYPSTFPEHGAAIVGSSNFTLAGFEGNTELNVRISGDAEMAALGEWFESLWAEAVDITQDVLVELRRSWPAAQTPPYHVYLKTLFELYRDELGLPPIEAAPRGLELANFQLDAVRQALAMIDRHGGCFIGDVVGLGKTYIGSEIVRQLQLTEPRGRHPLIVCPAGLVPMWERFNELFGLGAEIVSMSAIRPPAAARFDEEAGEYVEPETGEPGVNLIEAYPNRGVVLVDEVHNFRNAGTRRYRALFEYLWSGDHKVVLLSATPQNLGPRDIYHELRLFLDEETHGLNIEPLRLEENFAALQRWHEYQVELENWERDYDVWRLESRRPGMKRTPPPEQPSAPSVPYATIDQVLNPVFIRRRRKDIREIYGSDVELNGKPVRFPDARLHTLNYRLDKVYEQALPFDQLQERLKEHRGTRYLAVNYLKPAARTKSEYSDLIRARSRVATLMRFLLVKRLESSVAAFRSTLRVLQRSNRHFRTSLEAGFVPIGETATTVLSGDEFDVDELLARLQVEETRREERGAKRAKMVLPTADFEVDRWLSDLDADHAILSELISLLDRVEPDEDDKLQQLKRFLNAEEVREEKILIFSEAEATIDYLFDQLNPDGRDPSVAKVSGSNRDQIQNIIKRFAPKANLRPRERMPGPAVRVLLATDVVSEGQNMQDCNRVLNYDLHWNPVRLIQRFGRVDRIGTEHTTIHLHNTWPDTEVDEELSLTERLLTRIQSFHDMIGLDAPLLSQSERINPVGMYAIYEGKRLPEYEEDDVLDDVAAHQRGIALLQALESAEPDLWKTITTLPDGIRSALTLPPPPKRDVNLERFKEMANLDTVQIPLTTPSQDAGVQTPMDDPRPGETVVLLEQDGVTMAYAVDGDLHPRRVTPIQLVRAVTCERDAPADPLPRETNRRVMAAYDAARYEMSTRLGRDRRPTSDTRLRRYLTKQFRILRQTYREDEDELKRISVLQQIFPDHASPRAVEALEEIRRLEIAGDNLLRRLEALRALHRLNPPDEEDGPDEHTPVGVLRIVCSDGLI